MDKIGEQSNNGNDTIQAKKLPAEIVGRFLQNVSVADRLKGERVSPLWKRSLLKWGWTEQRKLDADIVFEGASAEEISRFWENLDDGICQLASLVYCCAPWIRELDLHSFGGGNIQRFLPQIVNSFELLKKLESLNIREFRLQDLVDHLQPTLRELKTSYGINIETLQALSVRCPELEEVTFEDLVNVNSLQTEALIELIGKFPRQKKLNLHNFSLPSEKQGALASIGQLKTLEHLDLWCCVSLDGESLGAIVTGCQRLRSFTFDTRKLTEQELFQLAKFSNLTVLKVDDRRGGNFSDAVLNAIAQRGQLKRLHVYGTKSSASLTDASVVYLVNRCKSLVSLLLFAFPQITERSLEAVVTEVKRRNGWPPETLPIGSLDAGIFYVDVLLGGNRVGRNIID